VTLVALAAVRSVDSLKSRTIRNLGSQHHGIVQKTPMGSLHEIVGPDGVLLIHLDRAGRAEFNQLNAAGVYPTLFPATDSQNATMEELNQGCTAANTSEASKCGVSRVGNGCTHLSEQAIAESHRRALVAAQSRNKTWTAIMEDDAVPLDPEQWNENFKELWASVPPNIGFLRLGWCTFGQDVEKREFASHADWQLIDRPTYASGARYYTGGCTTAYMVHRDYIPDVLSVFPCCGPVDTCYEWDLFYSPHNNCRYAQKGARICWGQQHMMGMDTKNSQKSTDHFTKKIQSGIIAQDNRESFSIRDTDIGHE
jgi:hypothetical protein